MYVDVPVMLYFDESIVMMPGRDEVIRWGVLNCAAKAITDLRIELSSANRQSAEAYFGKLSRGLWIEPGVYGVIVQNLKIADGEGRRAFDVHVSGTLEDGSFFDLVSLQPSIFKFCGPDDATRRMDIEIGGGGILNNLGDYYDQCKIRIEGSAILDFAQVSPRKQGCESNLDSKGTEIDPGSLRPVHLTWSQAIDGLLPLDLERFAAAWRGRRGLSLHFIDEERRPRGQAARVKDVYSLHVVAHDVGYLTIVAQGTTGEFFLFAPNTSTTPDTFYIQAGSSRFLPGELLPLPLTDRPTMGDMLMFCDAGEERILTLLTPRPLLEEPVNFRLEECQPETIIKLLRAAAEMSGASLAFAKILVEQRCIFPTENAAKDHA